MVIKMKSQKTTWMEEKCQFVFYGKNVAAFTPAAEMGWAQVKYSRQTGEAFFTVVLEDIVVKEVLYNFSSKMSLHLPAVVHDTVYVLVCSRATFTAGKQHTQLRDL